jgi:hypothetical protein
MNMKLKSLVAAAFVTMTLSGASNALTNNDIFLVANGTNTVTTVDAITGVSTSTVTNRTFIAALGQAGTTQAFNGTSPISANYATDTNWQNFVSGLDAGATYQVLGSFQSNANAPTGFNANDKILLTSSAANGTPGKLTNNQMNTLMANSISTGGSLGGFELLNSAITGTSTGLIIGTGANSFGAVSNNFFNLYLNANTVNAIGQDLNFYSVTRPNLQAGLTANVVTQYFDPTNTTADVWNLGSNGLLTYTATTVAAVPETNTWAMAMLGLGFMGFVARRRS